jgi:transcriptional regulator with XRE-family HTH domain
MEERMAEMQAGSTVPRRQLGRYLHDLRTKAGFTVRAAARELERSEPTLWRVETGKTAVRSLDVKAMCELYAATPELTKTLMALAKETRARGWWQAYGDVVPEWLDLFIGLEAAATRIWWYEADLVPGLFQTRDYARALIREHLPNETQAETDRRVELRLARQAILRRPLDPPLIKVVIRESVLCTPVGAAGVMAAQLEQLARASELPNVCLRVAPFAAGLHAGMLSGAFGILRFPVNGHGEDTEPPTVYCDQYTSALYLDQPHEVERYDRAFGKIWDAAPGEDTSRELLLQAAEERR